METRQRADELQQLVAATERDRLLLQQRLDDTRSVCQPRQPAVVIILKR